MEMHSRVFISNNLSREKSKTAERQKERESMRDRALLEVRESISNKIDHCDNDTVSQAPINA